MSDQPKLSRPTGAALVAALSPSTQPAPPALHAPLQGARSRWRSADLFGHRQEIEIEHGQALYRLRLTALGKLILTK